MAAKSKRLSQQAEQLSNPEAPENLILRIRELENRIAVSEGERKFQYAKAAQAQEELRSMREQWDLLVASQDKVTSRKLEKRIKHSPRNATAVICCNDWHVEESIDPATIDDANGFNLEVAERRLARHWQKCLYLLEFASSVSKIDEIVVWLGGDLINGMIHEEAEESNFLGPTEATRYIEDRVCEGIELLKRETKAKILVACNYGNHGRTTRFRRLSTGYRHSWEWLAYSHLERYYRDDSRVSWKIERGYHNWVDIQGWLIRFHHGDAIRFAGGVGGVHIPLRKAVSQWNKRRRADLDVLGHFHQYVDDWYYVVCGCLVGYNAFALEIKAEFQPPTQTFLLIDKEYGKTMALPIFCGETNAST